MTRRANNRREQVQLIGAEAGRPRNTIGMVDAARTVGVPEATMASTLHATRLEWSEGRNLTIEYRWAD